MKRIGPRYRRVSVQIHADARYRRLSAPPPNARTLFLHLLIGPSTGMVPGLYSVGEYALAEELGWPIEGFREALVEVQREQLVEVDWESRVVWVPNALKHNRPHNPNMVKSWKEPWDEIPDCALKAKAYQHFSSFLQSMGKPYLEPFLQSFGKPSAQHSGIQEQECDQKPSDDTDHEFHQKLNKMMPTPPNADDNLRHQIDNVTPTSGTEDTRDWKFGEPEDGYNADHNWHDDAKPHKANKSSDDNND